MLQAPAHIDTAGHVVALLSMSRGVSRSSAGHSATWIAVSSIRTFRPVCRRTCPHTRAQCAYLYLRAALRLRAGAHVQMLAEVFNRRQMAVGQCVDLFWVECVLKISLMKD